MTILTGTNIAKTFAEQNDYSKNQYFDTVEILLGIIERVLDSGEDIARSEILMDGCFYRIGFKIENLTVHIESPSPVRYSMASFYQMNLSSEGYCGHERR